MQNRIGPYLVLRLINEGGQGSVYLGYDDRLQRKIAIKIYRMPESRAAKKALLAEARLVAAIDSPRVVKVHDLISSDKHLAMIMEYVPGCDLETFLQGERTSLAAALAISADVAAGLASARQQGLVHGDVKASNVLITLDGHAKLTDFGIARTAHSFASGEGSSSAVTPEQLRGEKLDVRTDLFALGRLMYRMISGVAPFIEQGRLSRDALLEGRVQPLEEVVDDAASLPPGLSDLVMQMLAISPDQRPDNTHQVRQTLREIMLSLPLSFSSDLATAADAYFRSDRPDEVLLSLPAELRQQGSSALSSNFWERLVLRLGKRLAVGLAVFSLLSLALVCVVVWQHWPRTVYVAEPQLSIQHDSAVPADINSQWLIAQLKLALSEQSYPAVLTGPEKPADFILRVKPVAEDQPAYEQLTSTIYCQNDTCLLSISRRQGQRIDTEQFMLYASMDISQWRDAVAVIVQKLYRR